MGSIRFVDILECETEVDVELLLSPYEPVGGSPLNHGATATRIEVDSDGVPTFGDEIRAED